MSIRSIRRALTQRFKRSIGEHIRSLILLQSKARGDAGVAPLSIHQTRPLFPPLPSVAQLLQTPGEERLRSGALDLSPYFEETAQGEVLKKLNNDEIEQFVKADHYPLPAPEDREGYYGDQHVQYWISGLGDYVLLRALLWEQQVKLRAPFSLLDLGCASGRVLRHFAIHESGLQVYGADINRTNVKWVNAHLPRVIKCFQNTVLPSLPFGDHTLNLVYGCSVFTHIDDYESAWLLEIRRVLKPGGFAFITIHSDRTWKDIQEDHFLYEYFSNTLLVVEDLGITQITPELFVRDMPADRVVLTHTGSAINNTNVFHTVAYIQENWGRFFKICKIIPKAHGGHQDGVLLLKE